MYIKYIHGKRKTFQKCTHFHWKHSRNLGSHFMLASLPHASFAVNNLLHFTTRTYLLPIVFN